MHNIRLFLFYIKRKYTQYKYKFSWKSKVVGLHRLVYFLQFVNSKIDKRFSNI